jgi:hypothetical protein
VFGAVSIGIIFSAWLYWPTVRLWFYINEAYAASTVPKIINYQARVTDSSGVPVPNGSLSIKVSIYDSASGGTCLYAVRGSCGTPTAKTVTATNGVFSTLIGEAGDNTIPDALFDASALYLGITIGSDAEMTPRKRIGASGYALNADRLDNLDASNAGGSGAYVPVTDSSGNLVLTKNLTVDATTLFVDSTNDRVGIGTTAPGSKFVVSNDVNTFTISDTRNTNAGSDALTEIRALNDIGIGAGLIATSSTFNRTGFGIYQTPNLGGMFTTGGGGFVLVSEQYNAPMMFATGGYAPANERMRITSDGKIGIGTTNPGARLTISASATAPTGNLLEVQNLNNSNRYFTISSTATISTVDVVTTKAFRDGLGWFMNQTAQPRTSLGINNGGLAASMNPGRIFSATGTNAWTTFDPISNGVGSGVDGYLGSVFDGRYVYFAPYNTTGDASGEVMRYDTTANFASAGAWSSFDPGANGVGTTPKGFIGAAFDGRYLYFVPSHNGTEYFGEVLRYDTTAPFASNTSWATYDAGANGVGADPDGFVGGIFDGRYVYFVPSDNGTERNGEVMRYDTTGAFRTASSWSTFDAGANGVGADPDGYGGTIFDGRFIYFVPGHNGTERHGEVLRYDTAGTFDSASSWSTFDAGASGIGTDPDGYIGGAYDGRYVYFAPYNNGVEQHGEVLRYDAAGSFSSASSWSTFDPGASGIGTDPDGYYGATFDGRYVYFSPQHNGATRSSEVLRYDTGAPMPQQGVGQAARSKDLFIDSIGRVGIGTASPSARLDVAGSIVNTGGLTSNALGIPSAPTVTPQGASGSTIWGYKLTAVSSVGETTISASGSTLTGNATLTSSNFNRIAWTAVPGAKQYKIYRHSAGGSPSTRGLIATIAAVSIPQFDDTGLAASGSEPGANRSGYVGIGTTAPTIAKLQITGDSAPDTNSAGIALEDTRSGGKTYVLRSEASDFNIYDVTSGAVRLNMNGAFGKVTLGQTFNPTYRLAVPNNEYFSGINVGGTADLALIGTNGSDQISIAPGGQATVIAGNVGIGATIAPYRLTAAASSGFSGTIFAVRDSTGGTPYLTTSTTSTNVFGDLIITGTCTGCGGGATALNAAYNASTSTIELPISTAKGALTLQDAFSPVGNVFEIVNRLANSSYDSKLFMVSATGVGIGTNTPGSPTFWGNATVLHVKSINPGPAVIRLEDSGAGTSGGVIETEENSPIRFYTNLNERLRITGGGNVGIGNTTPPARLTVTDALGTPTGNIFEVWNNGGSSKYLTVSSTSVNITGDLAFTGTCNSCAGTLNQAYNNSTSTSELWLNSNATHGALTLRDTIGGIGGNLFEIRDRLANDMYSTNYFTVSATGVGIGTAPSSILHVKSATSNHAELRLDTSDGSSIPYLTFFSNGTGAGSIQYRPDNAGLHIQAGGAAYPANTQMSIMAGGNVGIGATAPPARLTVADALGSPTGNIFEVWNNGGSSKYLTVSSTSTIITHTLPASPSSTVNAVKLNIASAGSASQGQQGLRVDFNAGYTGSSGTYAADIESAVAGTGADAIGNIVGNFGIYGASTATTTGDNVGLFGNGTGGNRSYGVVGWAVTAKASAVNVGVVGVGRNTGGSSTEVGGYFGLQTATPTFASAALVADNGATTNPIFLGRDNGSAIFSIIDGGNVGINTTSPQAKLHVNGNLRWGGSTSAPYSISDVDTGGLYIEHKGTTTANDDIRFQTATSGDGSNYVQLVLDPSYGAYVATLGTGAGNFGIGDATPDSPLTVRSGFSGTLFQVTDANNSAAYLTVSGTNTVIGSASSTYVITTTGARVAGNLTPETDNTYDLGDYNRRWKTLHVGPGSVIVHNDATSADQFKLDYSGATARLFASSAAIQITNGANTGITLDTAGTFNYGSGNAFQIESDGDVVMTKRLDLAGHGNNVGLNIPTFAGSPSVVTGSAEGDLVWDSTNNALYIHNGSAFASVGGSSLTNPTVSGNLMPAVAPTYLTTLNQTATAATSTGSVGDHVAAFRPAGGTPFIFFRDETDSDLEFLKCGDALCASNNNTFVTPDSAGTVGTFIDSATGSDGLPVASYVNSSGDIKFVKCANATCSASNTVVTINTSQALTHTSITVPADGNPIIAYAGATTIKTTKCGNADCTSGNVTTTLATPGAAVTDANIAVPLDGLPIIIYRYTGLGPAIRAVKCGNASCSSGNTSIEVSATGYAGPVAMALGSDDLPVFVTQMNSTLDVRFFKCYDAICSSFQSTDVDTDPDASAGKISIAVPSDGLPVVSYYTNNGANLKFLKCGNGFCSNGNTVNTLDSVDTAGNYSSIALASDGLPMIAYNESVNGDVKIIKCGNARCAPDFTGHSTIVINDVVGIHISLFIPAGGNPFLAYYDDTNDDLEFAKCDTSTCASSTENVYTGGSNIGSSSNFFNNIYAETFWGKELNIEAFDLAESYRVDDSTISEGDIVRISVMSFGDRPTVEKTDKDYDRAIGIVSTKPGLKLSDWSNSSDGRLVALVGRVPTKVSAENGPIIPGDAITSSSSTPGIGMKATGSGQVVGYALDAWSGTGIGRIDVFVNPSWDSGVSSLTDESGTSTLTVAGIPSQDFGGNLLTAVGGIVSSSGLWSVSTDGYLIAQHIEAKTVTAEQFKIRNDAADKTAGNGLLKAGYSAQLVQNSLITPQSLIVVTFEGNPGSAWWVNEKQDGQFMLNLAAPAPMNTPFTYWIVGVEGAVEAPTAEEDPPPEDPPPEDQPSEPQGSDPATGSDPDIQPPTDSGTGTDPIETNEGV